MNDIFAEFALMVSSSFILTVLVKSTVILMLGLTFGALAFRAKASLRHLAFATTFAALLALPLGVLTLPEFALEVPTSAGPVAERSASAPPAASIQATAAQTAKGEAAAISETPISTRSVSSSSPLSLTLGFALVWAGGALLLGALLAIDMWRVRQLRRHGIPSERLQSAADLLTGYGKRRVEVLMNEYIHSPVTFGFFRPVIMLPVGAEEWGESDVRRALVHELEHVRRADWTTQLTARVACSLYWFHPLVWVSWRRLCLEAERACDDAVVENAGHSDYAEQLVSLSRQLIGTREPAVLGMAKRSDLSRRVSALLDQGCRRGRLSFGATAVAISIGALAVVSIGSLRAVAQAPAPLTLNKPATAKALAIQPVTDVPKEVGTENVIGQTIRANDVETTLAPTATLRPELNEPLFKAAERNDIERAKALIADGADVNAVLRGDGTPLIAAAREGHLEMVRLLLDSGAKPDLGVSGDGNPLLNAAREGHRDVVILLLERGADIDAGVEGDGNALIMASGRGYVNIVKLLLDRGANIHKVVAGDENAIIKAGESGQLEVIKLLLERGADINSRVRVENGWGDTQRVEYRTPLSMARKNGHKAVVDYLLSKGARDQ